MVLQLDGLSDDLLAFRLGKVMVRKLAFSSDEVWDGLLASELDQVLDWVLVALLVSGSDSV